jgi:hypothetical protein
MSVECRFDAVIIGAGAAGVMCGRTAGQRGRKVLLLDRSPRAGRKIAIPGGGRCNFTNLHVDPGNYLSENPAFCTSALRRFTPIDFLKLAESHGIAYHEKVVGQLFCDDRGSRIVELLPAECKAGNVAIRTGCTVRSIVKKQGFEVHTNAGTSRELSSKTLESRKVPGLFFAGEVLDVAGWLGGYNFQWAWSAGLCAGVYV